MFNDLELSTGSSDFFLLKFCYNILIIIIPVIWGKGRSEVTYNINLIYRPVA
jgi:hypothetical protein